MTPAHSRVYLSITITTPFLFWKTAVQLYFAFFTERVHAAAGNFALSVLYDNREFAAVFGEVFRLVPAPSIAELECRLVSRRYKIKDARLCRFPLFNVVEQAFGAALDTVLQGAFLLVFFLGGGVEREI